MMKPSQYLRIRAQALYEGKPLPKALSRDWLPYARLTMPEGEEWLTASLDESEHALRLCLAAAIAEDDERPICQGCAQEIDPNVCWCGEAIDGHIHDGHSPIPMGCNCYRA